MRVGESQSPPHPPSNRSNSIPNRSLDSPSSLREPGNPHLQFEKNYPKNIFIPMIQHLSQLGLKGHYQACVGTRESFEGKNVVSLAQIHRVMSQEWFMRGINLGLLLAKMSNKILMNSKIKKKLFHLLLIQQLFTIPLNDARQFKKTVSRTANQIAQRNLPDDQLFYFPSALIYLLHLFAQGLGHNRPQRYGFKQSVGQDEQIHKSGQFLKIPKESSKSYKECSSKLEYKYYVGKIISSLNSSNGSFIDLRDQLDSIKHSIYMREMQVRQKYKLDAHVPEWNSFNMLVVDRCLMIKRNRQRLTYSLLNGWVQEFKENASTIRGGMEVPEIEGMQVEMPIQFQPIILVYPPS